MELYEGTIRTEGVVHSLGGRLDQVEILGKLNDEQYVGRYNGVVCTAILNVFNYHFYLDDIYGILPDDWETRFANG